jgi:hypothetical protein
MVRGKCKETYAALITAVYALSVMNDAIITPDIKRAKAEVAQTRHDFKLGSDYLFDPETAKGLLAEFEAIVSLMEPINRPNYPDDGTEWSKEFEQEYNPIRKRWDSFMKRFATEALPALLKGCGC